MDVFGIQEAFGGYLKVVEKELGRIDWPITYIVSDKEFNSVRTALYREGSVFDGLLPASTGMGGNNPIRAALKIFNLRHV